MRLDDPYVPGPKGPNLNLLPHVLIIEQHDATDTHDADKEYTVEHHADCPLVCAWYPGDLVHALQESFGGVREDPGHHTCYVAYEVEYVGLDALEIDTLDTDDHIDKEWVRGSEFEADWLRLKPGRYIIEGWFTPQGWAGSEPIDADGGLTLIGLAEGDTP